MEIREINVNHYNNKSISRVFPGYDIKKYKNSKEHKFYEILIDNNFAGFYNLYQGNRIQKFFIEEKFRKMKLGTLVISLLKQKRNDYYCYVKKNNTIALKFWEKNGFIISKNIGNILLLKQTNSSVSL